MFGKLSARRKGEYEIGHSIVLLHPDPSSIMVFDPRRRRRKIAKFPFVVMPLYSSKDNQHCFDDTLNHPDWDKCKMNK